MSGLYLRDDRLSSVAGSYFLRQYELRRIYKKSFFSGMALALGLQAVLVYVLFLLTPALTKPASHTVVLLPPVNVKFKVIQMQFVGRKPSGMDIAGAGGGNGTVQKSSGAAYAIATPSNRANPNNTIDRKASIVPRSLQGPGMNDVVGINRKPAFFDTASGFSGNSQNGSGSGAGIGSTIGDTTGIGSGITGKPGFGGGFGDRFVPGNPSNNSASGTPYAISWNGVPRALVSGDRPKFPRDAQSGGVVKIRIMVSPAGNVVSMIPLQKSGQRLEEAAMSAIRSWQFSRLANKYPQVNQSAVATFVFKAE